MPIAIGLLTIGLILLKAGWKNESVVDVVLGRDTRKSGGNVPAPVSDGTDVTGITDTATGGGTPPQVGHGTISLPGRGFSGPHASLLMSLAVMAVHGYGLTITATTNGVHVPGSYHYQGRAFDCSGAEKDMHNFAQYVEGAYTPQLKELIHNPGFAVKDGKVVSSAVYAAVWAGHRNHVHVAA